MCLIKNISEQARKKTIIKIEYTVKAWNILNVSLNKMKEKKCYFKKR